jgi:hypothetical protein
MLRMFFRLNSFCPWFAFFSVVFKNTEIDAKINHTLWSIWDPGDERTEYIFFADFNTFGRGTRNISRPSFATELTTYEAKAYNISSAVGSDYASWVDLDYFVWSLRLCTASDVKLKGMQIHSLLRLSIFTIISISIGIQRPGREWDANPTCSSQSELVRRKGMRTGC